MPRSRLVQTGLGMFLLFNSYIGSVIHGYASLLLVW
jgi:hypothetical protein